MEKSTFRMMERLKRLYAVVNRMEKAEGTIPQMEIDLLLEELRGMYAEALLLNTPDNLPWEEPSQEEEPMPEPVELESEAVQEPEVEVEEIPVDELAPESEMAEEVISEPSTPMAESAPTMEQTTLFEEEPQIEPATTFVAAASALHVAEALADMGSLQFAKEESEIVDSMSTSQPSMEELEGMKNDELFSEVQPVEQTAEVMNPTMAAPMEETPVPEPVGEPMEEPVVESLTFESIPASEEVIAPQFETASEPVEPSAPEPVATPESETKTLGEQVVEAPKTLWEQLQSKQSSPTLADMFQTETPVQEPTSPWSVEPIIAEAQQTQQAQQQLQPEQVSQQPIQQQRVVFESEAPAPAPEPQPAPEPVQIAQPAPAQQPSGSPSLLDLLRQSNAVESTPVEHPAHTLGESFVSGAESNTESHVNRQKVADLRTVININDKFSFMSELFHNNMKAYNDFILRLNAISSSEEAYAYVNEVANQYGWVSDSLAVHTFFSILERKF